MTIRGGSRLVGLALVAGAATVAGVAGARAETVVFAYAPPVGRAFDLAESHLESFELGASREQLQVTSRSRLEYGREGNQYLLSSRFDAVDATSSAHPEEVSLAQALLGAEFVRRIRPDGSLAAIEGNRAIYRKLVAATTGDKRAAFQATLDADVVDDLDLYNWRQQVEMLVGQTLEIGHDYWFEDAFPVGVDGWVPHQTLFHLGPWEDRPQGKLLRIAVAYVADARAAIPTAIHLQSRVRSLFDPARPPKVAGGYRLSGNASNLVDPKTLVYWQAQVIRKIQQLQHVSEEISVTVTREQRETGVLTVAPATKP